VISSSKRGKCVLRVRPVVSNRVDSQQKLPDHSSVSMLVPVASKGCSFQFRSNIPQIRRRRRCVAGFIRNKESGVIFLSLIKQTLTVAGPGWHVAHGAEGGRNLSLLV
jgi:hypothetical protein